METFKRIGFVAVDSGRVLVIDPCNVAGMDVSGADVKGKYGVSVGVVAEGFGGDGIFPVFLVHDEKGVVTQIVISFSKK